MSLLKFYIERYDYYHDTLINIHKSLEKVLLRYYTKDFIISKKTPENPELGVERILDKYRFLNNLLEGFQHEINEKECTLLIKRAYDMFDPFCSSLKLC